MRKRPIQSAYSLLTLFLLFHISSAQARDYIVLGNVFPPFGKESQSETKGFSIEVLRLLTEESNGLVNITKTLTTSFNREYNSVRDKPNTIGLHLAKSEQRSHLFKWVGPYYQVSMGLIGRSDKNYSLENIEDIKRYTIGAVNGTLPEELLYKKHPSLAIQTVSTPITGIKMLDRGRWDLFAHVTTSSNYLMKQNGFDIRRFEEKLNLKTADLYFAFSKDTPDEDIKQLNVALKTILEAPKFRELCKRYYLSECS